MLSAEVLQPVGQATSSQARRLRASLELEFRQSAGATQLAHSRQEPPLRVVRTFAREDSSALVHLHNVSGGLLGGDELRLRVDAGEGTNVVLTTTGATRIYRPRTEAPPARQINEISVARGGLLEYVPDQIIPFSGARFSQRTTIRLAEDAGLFWWEVLAPGREAHGELFAYEQIDMKMDVMALERPIACEQICLQPGGSDSFCSARLGGYRYWASFYVCRVGVTAKAWLAAEESLRALVRSLGDPAEVRWGITTLAAHGLAIRCLARRGHQVFVGLRALWSAAKSILYQREAIPPRKVQ